MRNYDDFEKSLKALNLPKLEQKVGSVYIDVDVLLYLYFLGHPHFPHQRRRNLLPIFTNDRSRVVARVVIDVAS